MPYGDVLLYENPYGTNPRKRRKRRNVRVGAGALQFPAPMRRWMMGVDLVDLIAATGGLAAATMIPATFVKDTSTALRKFGKIGVSLGSAVIASMLAEALSKGSGKSAILGGVAGTGAMSLGMFTQFQIGAPRRLISGSRTVNIGEPRTVTAEEAQAVQVSVT